VICNLIMPKCEGYIQHPGSLPICPGKVNNRTVKLTQGDMMLCHACTEARFPSAPLDIDKQLTTKKIAIKQPVKSLGRRESKRGKILEPMGENDENEDCPGCLLPRGDLQTCLWCDVCANYHHYGCTSVPAKAYSTLAEIIDYIGWVCDECKLELRSHYRQLQSGLNKLTEDLGETRDDVAELKVQISNASDSKQAVATVNAGYAANTSVQESVDIAAVVHRTLRDAAKRKRNVIVLGLPERDDIDDRTAIQAFLRLISEPNRSSL
jgi:hypothetical protein